MERPGSGNIVHSELFQAQECGMSNEIARTLCNVLFTHGLVKFIFIFTLKVKWMSSLMELILSIESNER